ncbi:nonribosomal siderophore peptide synthase Sid2 [Calycina marina]|uniref:Nonribosomal siderophore peptide synthase Sid2 n=1 Tax=Calycina marina TaxID=1763456 RepID=A0A9P8CH55_9HELO|nr:nonribosomal siderophore peptide synthase Sid2 [Calycina marina]
MAQTNDEEFQSFELAGLASGTRLEVLLVSWLIVLLRNNEEEKVCFDWTPSAQSANLDDGQVNRTLTISMDEVLTSLQSSVNEVVEALSCQIKAFTSSQHEVKSTSVSHVLSTTSPSRTSQGAQDEDMLHLELRSRKDLLEIRPVWASENTLPYTMCIASPDASIANCLRPTNHDLNDIWEWNHTLPPAYSFSMHERVSDQSQKFPDKVAIDSWDGTLTYFQVDKYSTAIACSLKDIGITFGDVVPVCFEKSRWTIVALLAVMKSGATLVLMDPTLPLLRLQNMREQYDLSKLIIPNGSFVIVEEDTFPTVPSSNLMYIIFTSGSTGTPKGVKISHGTYTSSAFPRAEAVGYTEKSRVLDFASYAFDVSIDSMLLTLGNGGCLCIPSDEDRLNNINGVIRDMKVTYAGITPSVARILDADVIASLDGLGLGGESVTRIIIGYGPCECRNYISIGQGNGAAMWIANPNDHDLLMPVGAVGELLVEGPIVGQGYLNDEEKTVAAFIHDPPWLVTGRGPRAGRRGVLYKTGDLGKYDPNGSGGIVFAGRKDTQVKLRGQRVELGEIESQLRARLPSDTNVIAEVLVPLGSGGQSTLVAFVKFESLKIHESTTDLLLLKLPRETRTTLSKADAELAHVLPRYMIPTAYIPVNNIPVLISGKTDRKKLRQFGATVDLRDLEEVNPDTDTWQPSDLQLRLQQAWAEVLKLDVETIRPNDNFFVLGGDSLMAMKLVSACRAQGLDLTVTGIFSNPNLSVMGGIVQACETQESIEIPAFSMICQDIESACAEAAQICGTDLTAIEDIYPCTPTQESLFTFALKSSKVYVAQRVSCIPSQIELDACKKAWEEVVTASPILRTRVAQLQDPGLQQVILKQSISWKYHSDLAQYLEIDRTQKMDLGESLSRYAIVDNTADSKRYMVWTVHHVLYDGFSEPLILKEVSKALESQYVKKSTMKMRDFVRWVHNSDKLAMQEYWRRELRNAVGPQFPRLPSRDYIPTPDSMTEHHIALDTSSGSTFTLPTLIRGAWALVASQYTGSNDVVFGETLMGRDVALPGIEGIIGPLIATVPVRVHVNREMTIDSYLAAVQQSMLDRTPYQHMGMQNIRKVSQDAQHACEAGTGLVIQPEPEYTGSELGFDQGDVVREALHFNPYPFMLAFGIQKGGFRVCASWDSSLIGPAQTERILKQLEMACAQLARGTAIKIGQISCIADAELNKIWSWNQQAPMSLDSTSGKLRAEASINQGTTYPPAVVRWVCDPRNVSLLSPIGCVGELWLEESFSTSGCIDPPVWLMAGSSAHAGRKGRLQPTADMVQLQEDGSLVFAGRRENVSAIHGHAVDIIDIETHLTKHLPPNISAFAVVRKAPSNDTQAVSEQDLIVLIEQQSSEVDCVELMPTEYKVSNEFGSENTMTTICAAIPISLLLVLKDLNQFIQDSLPSYMLPSAYVVVDMIGDGKEAADRSSLNQLASNIPHDVLTQLQETLKKAWKEKSSAKTNLTRAESIIRSSWALILGLDPEQINISDNFFRLGGDSVLAMKLVSNLRLQGHSLSVADIFRYMRLCDAAKVLKMDEVAKVTQPYTPFSILGDLDVEPFLQNVVQPQLANPNWSIQDVSPVTDSQALDVRATIQVPRTSVQYTMLYFDRGADREQISRSCNELVKMHEILRTVVIKNGSDMYQVVINDLDTEMAVQKTDGDLEQYVVDFCKGDIESDFSLGSTFLKLVYVESNNGQTCLILRLSHSQYDGESLPQLLRDLETLYTGGKPIKLEPFSSYTSHIHDPQAQSKALAYWTDLLKHSSLSVLPGKSSQPTSKAIFQTVPVNISHRPVEITTATLLLAAWSLLLARRLQTASITFGTVTSGRAIALANIEHIQGPTYQIAPFRVVFQQEWTAIDLLRSIQAQSTESAAHDFIGFKRIAAECAQWSQEQFFDSVVHHQDFEDFESMPFAGGEARVDVLNPHGDAADPLKAVSLIQGGETRVGIVGSESDGEFVGALLEELAATVEEFGYSSEK